MYDSGKSRRAVVKFSLLCVSWFDVRVERLKKLWLLLAIELLLVFFLLFTVHLCIRGIVF